MTAPCRPETATHLWCSACKRMQLRNEFCRDARAAGGIAYACREARGVRAVRSRAKRHQRERLKLTLFYHLLTVDELQGRLDFWNFIVGNATNPNAVTLARHQAKRAADWLFLQSCRAQWALGRHAPSIMPDLPMAAELVEAAMSKRGHISLKTKLAAALCVLFEIPHEHAKAMHEEQVLSLADWDHFPIPKAHDGEDTHYNLVPRPKPTHRIKTATQDIPMMAKTKRLAASDAKHKAIMAAKIGLESENMDLVADALAPVGRGARPKRKLQGRGFSKEHQPMRSRSSFGRRG